jgi:predicted nucleic acid-binding protein
LRVCRSAWTSPQQPAPGTTTLALALARSHSLTSYDAAYLELALRRGLPLASRDQALQAAARAEGVPLLPS